MWKNTFNSEMIYLLSTTWLVRQSLLSNLVFPFSVELAMIMDRLYGGVCYAGIDTDPELKYPKGAGRVAFSNQQSYIAAISARFVQLQHGEIDKRVLSNKFIIFGVKSLLRSVTSVILCKAFSGV
jgi:hypothetical protein